MKRSNKINETFTDLNFILMKISDLIKGIDQPIGNENYIVDDMGNIIGVICIFDNACTKVVLRDNTFIVDAQYEDEHGQIVANSLAEVIKIYEQGGLVWSNLNLFKIGHKIDENDELELNTEGIEVVEPFQSNLCDGVLEDSDEISKLMIDLERLLR